MAATKPAAVKYQYSKPSLKGVMNLNTEQAKFFAGNRFDSLMTALFIVDVTSRNLAKRLKTFNHKAVVDAVSSKIEAMETSINDEIVRLETMLTSLGVTERAGYSSPLVREFQVTSPEIKRMSKVLQSFDTLITLVDTAWLGEKIESSEAEEFRVAKSDKMAKLIRSLVGLGQSARVKAYSSKSAELKAEIEKVEAAVLTEKAAREASGFIEQEVPADQLDSLEEAAA
ncbi:hypothetical protein [Pseudomonas sp. 2FE]|uniref:hypothetical protein n=1 Tax=Pseudomonas sp. 2FE TaxID=2502190 RepID=UPI0010F8E1BB|nr:hypothetical protein [Pseudomonas sp. 2FE]